MSDPAASAEPSRLALDANATSSRKKIISWAMWDWGTQPFNTVIVTFVFAAYITGSAFGDTNFTSTALGVSTTIAGILVALLAPVLGQTADRSGHTVRNLRFLTWGLAAVSAALFFIKPAPEYLIGGLVLLGIGTVISEIASVNYNSLIDEVATGHNVGRVSGFGWGLGYVGGIVVLMVLYFGFISPDVGLFGVTGTDGMDIRVSMLVCAAWTLLFTIPIFLNLKDRGIRRAPHAPNRFSTRKPAWLWCWLGPAVFAYAELGRSLGGLWRVSRVTVYFLLASALFRDGLNAVFAFGGVVAQGTFGFSAGDVIIFGAAANIVAGLSTMAFGLLDDKLGPKKVIMIALISIVLMGSAIFAFHDRGAIVFWICGLGMSAFVGPAQSASRSYLARLIPEGQSGEIFGLYATTGRVVSFVGSSAFVAAITLGHTLTGEANTQYWGIGGIVAVLLAGLLVMIPVKEPKPTVTAS